MPATLWPDWNCPPFWNVGGSCGASIPDVDRAKVWLDVPGIDVHRYGLLARWGALAALLTKNR
jgi:hypothetical protein